MDALTGGLTIGITIQAIDKYSKEFSKAKTSMNQFKIAAIGAASIAGAALVAFGISATQAAADSEIVASRVESAFGQMSNVVFESSKIMQNSSINSDEVIQQSFIDLERVAGNLGLTVQQQAKIIQSSMDIAASSGKSFDEVMNAVLGGIVGRTTALEKLGVTIEKGASQQEILNSIISRGGEVMGAAEKETNTFNGALKQLNNQWDEIKEKNGKPLLTLFLAFKPVLIDLANLVGGALLYGFRALGEAFLGFNLVLGEVAIAVQFVADLFTKGWSEAVDNAKYRQKMLVQGLEEVRDKMYETSGANSVLTTTSNIASDALGSEASALIDVATEAAKTSIELERVSKWSDIAFSRYSSAVRMNTNDSNMVQNTGKGGNWIGAWTPAGTDVGGGWTAKGFSGTEEQKAAQMSLKSSASGFEGHLSQDTLFKAHAGEDVSIKPAGTTNNMGGLVFNIYETSNAQETAREIVKQFQALGA